MLRIVETDKPIHNLPIKTQMGFDVVQACPINMIGGTDRLSTVEIANLIVASEGRPSTGLRLTQHYPMRFFHPMYATPQEIADNYQLPFTHTPRDILPKLQQLRETIGEPDVLYQELEFNPIHHGNDQDVADAFWHVKQILISRGVADDSWTNDEWTMFCWRSYAATIEATLNALGWSKTKWIGSNAHAEDRAILTDDYGNKCPPAFAWHDKPDRMIEDLYVYPAGFEHDVRAVNFVATEPLRAVHVSVGDAEGGKIAPEQVLSRCQQIARADGGIVMFVGNPDAAQGASGMPETNTRGRCAAWILAQPGV